MDRSLVEQARDGDAAAYDRLAREASRRLFLIAHRILRDTDAAEDAVQQTLVTIWRELPRLRDPERFDVWSYRIVTRAAITEAKRKRRTVRIADMDMAEPSATDGMANVATRDSLERAFARMKPESRAVLVLRYYVDLPIKEIAEDPRHPIRHGRVAPAPCDGRPPEPPRHGVAESVVGYPA